MLWTLLKALEATADMTMGEQERPIKKENTSKLSYKSNHVIEDGDPQATISKFIS